MIDLTLNSFLHPNILGLQPQFGTIITPDTQNKGGLSTAQVDSNMAMPFALMRPILVSQTDKTSEIEYDAKLLITGDQSVTITLGDAVYEGCKVVITNQSTQKGIVTASKIENISQGQLDVEINNPVELVYTEAYGWCFTNFEVGYISISLSDTLRIGHLWCDGQEYNVIDYPRLAPKMLPLPFNVDVPEGKFRVPDLRECTLVGIGENTTLTIASHDIYTLGEFKDDQFQGHKHDGIIWSTDFGAESGDGAAIGIARQSTTRNIVTDGINGEPRIGDTTHGKQVGVNYIIKY